MTDLEITKACAEAVGYEVLPTKIKNYCRVRIQYPSSHHDVSYEPFSDGAQCFDLMKKFGLHAIWFIGSRGAIWSVTYPRTHPTASSSLNRAICECVAHLTPEGS